MHPTFQPGTFPHVRYAETVATGRPTWRKGKVVFLYQAKHKGVENLFLPFARDGATVDMLMVCSILYDQDGKEM